MILKVIVEDAEGSWVLCIHQDRTWDMWQHLIGGHSRPICDGVITDNGTVAGHPPSSPFPIEILRKAQHMLAIVCEPPA